MFPHNIFAIYEVDNFGLKKVLCCGPTIAELKQCYNNVTLNDYKDEDFAYNGLVYETLELDSKTRLVRVHLNELFSRGRL